MLQKMPRVIVSIYYKCAWCWPDDSMELLGPRDRDLVMRQRHAMGSVHEETSLLCPKPYPPKLAGLCESRIREIPAFDDDSTGNTKVIQLTLSVDVYSTTDRRVVRRKLERTFATLSPAVIPSQTRLFFGTHSPIITCTKASSPVSCNTLTGPRHLARFLSRP